MVTCVIYMHFSSSTKQQDHPCRRECYDFVTFDIRLLYLLGVYFGEVHHKLGGHGAIVNDQIGVVQQLGRRKPAFGVTGGS